MGKARLYPLKITTIVRIGWLMQQELDLKLNWIQFNRKLKGKGHWKDNYKTQIRRKRKKKNSLAAI